jgi:hypothetical protein
VRYAFSHRIASVRISTVSPLRVVSNCPVWGVVHRHPNRPPKGDGLLRNLCQGLMDIGLLRQRCVEVDAKNLLNPDESGYEDRRGYRPLGGDDRMWSEPQTRSPVLSNFAFGRCLGQCLLLRLGARHDSSANPFRCRLAASHWGNHLAGYGRFVRLVLAFLLMQRCSYYRTKGLSNKTTTPCCYLSPKGRAGADRTVCWVGREVARSHIATQIT